MCTIGRRKCTANDTSWCEVGDSTGAEACRANQKDINIDNVLHIHFRKPNVGFGAGKHNSKLIDEYLM